MRKTAIKVSILMKPSVIRIMNAPMMQPMSTEIKASSRVVPRVQLLTMAVRSRHSRRMWSSKR